MDALTPVDLANAMFERSHHSVTDVRSCDARGGGKEARCNRRNAIRTISPLLQPISKPSNRQRQMRSSAARPPSGPHGAGVMIEAVDLITR
jgi:hypothetical protein